MHHKRMDVSFWLHKSKTPGYARIYCRITILGEREEIGSTGITIYRQHWNKDAKRISKADPLSQVHNELLITTEMHLVAIYSDLLRREAHITAAKIRCIYQRGVEVVSLLSAFDLYLLDVKADPKRSPATYMVYDNVRKKLTDFLTSQKATDMPIVDFDLSWLSKYRRWMKTIPVDNASRRGKLHSRPTIGHADSYIRKQSQTVMQVMRWAKLHHLSPANPLEGYRVPDVEYPSPLFLSDLEFNTL